MLNKTSLFEKENLGLILVVEKKFPLNYLSKEPIKIYYKPNLSGAGWHKIKTDAVEVEEFLEKENALEVMALLRERDAAELVQLGRV